MAPKKFCRRSARADGGIFQHPFYPYCGTENPAPNMCNVPLPAGTRGEDFRQVVYDIWLPRLREFKPEMIFVSAGFDAHYEDDMASLGLVESDYAWVTQQIKQIAGEFQGAHRFPAGRRLCAFGAGAQRGYAHQGAGGFVSATLPGCRACCHQLKSAFLHTPFAAASGFQFRIFHEDHTGFHSRHTHADAGRRCA
jgi:hypothetical protein